MTESLGVADAIGPAVFRAPAAAAQGRSRDQAVTELYSLHYRALVRLAVLLVRDLPTAEDVVQDSFAALHGGWQRLRDTESALAYLRSAVLNRSRSVLRHRAVADKHMPKPPPDMPSAEHSALAQLERSAMGISRGAVKSHTARGMAALRAELERQDRPGQQISAGRGGRG